MEKGLWKDGRAAQRFKRVEGDKPVLLLDALVKAFPQQSPELIKKCLDAGDILVNEKPTNSAVQVTGKDEVLIMFGGKKDCYASTNKWEYFAEGVHAGMIRTGRWIMITITSTLVHKLKSMTLASQNFLKKFSAITNGVSFHLGSVQEKTILRNLIQA